MWTNSRRSNSFFFLQIFRTYRFPVTPAHFKAVQKGFFCVVYSPFQLATERPYRYEEVMESEQTNENKRLCVGLLLNWRHLCRCKPCHSLSFLCRSGELGYRVTCQKDWILHRSLVTWLSRVGEPASGRLLSSWFAGAAGLRHSAVLPVSVREDFALPVSLGATPTSERSETKAAMKSRWHWTWWLPEETSPDQK